MLKVKAEYYNKAKQNATELGIVDEKLKMRWLKTNADFWKNENDKYVKEIKKRDRLFKKMNVKAANKKIEKRYTDSKGKTLKDIEEEYNRVSNHLKKKKFTKPQIMNLIKNEKFAEVFQNMIDTKKPLTVTQGQVLWNMLNKKKNMTIKVAVKNDRNAKYIPLNKNNYDRFSNLFMDFGEPSYSIAISGSDEYGGYGFDSVVSVSAFSNVKVNRKIANKNQAFFEYQHDTFLNLTKYQIECRASGEDVNDKRVCDNCLIHTLKMCGIDESTTNRVALAFATKFNLRYNDRNDRKIYRTMSYTAKKDLKIVANIIGCNIKLHWINSDGDLKITDFMPKIKTKKKIHMATFKNHYFIYEKSEYTKYVVLNEEDLSDEFMGNYHGDIVGKDENGNYIRDYRCTMNSLRLIELMYKEGLFTKYNMEGYHEMHEINTINDDVYLDSIHHEQEEFEVKDRKPTNKNIIYYCDTESFVNPKYYKYHELKLLGCVPHISDIVNIIDVDDDKHNKSKFHSKEQMAIYEWLDIVTGKGKSDAICYFHNLKYDLNVIERFLNISSKCEKDGAIYKVVVSHKSRKVILKDSYKLVGFALRKFGKIFELDKNYRKKEALAYEYYTHKNVGKTDTKISVYSQYLSKKEKLILKCNLKADDEGLYSYDPVAQTFDSDSYYKDYLRMDCLVLKKSLVKFDTIINDITNKRMSVYDYLTISSLSDRYMQLEGSYEGIFEVKGNLREYISRAVYGGKVDVNKKFLKKIITGKIADFDEVSSYPSAINRWCKEYGLPKGMAKRIKKKYLNSILDDKSLTYAIFTVEITKVNKKQQMPFIAVKTENGSTQYINEPPGKDLVIDLYTLQDYIKFHDIEYTIKDGVYWNEGYNKKMGKVISDLFQQRLLKKKNVDGTPSAIGEIIKLMLNSAYGKTILSKSNTKKVIVKEKAYKKNKKTGEFVIANEHNFENYVYNNHNTIKTYRRINKIAFEVEYKCIDDSFNRAHIGCAILSMSKRMMGEVFDVANTLDKPIYYTDTDSLHCNNADIPAIAKKFEELYGKQLVGKQLGQFHVDFKLKGAKEGADIFAIKSIFLGKKSYHDLLESVDKNGKTIYGTHNRMKGITKEGLEHTAATKYGGDYTKMYEFLTGEDKSITFLLNPYNVTTGKKKVLMDLKHGQVKTKDEFQRTVKF